MRYVVLALMGLFLSVVDLPAQESVLPNQVETTLRSRHFRRHHHHSSSDSSSANVIVGPPGPMGPPGIPGATGATGSLASSYASVYNLNNQSAGTFINPTTIAFNNQEVTPVNVVYSFPGTFDTLQVQTSGVYLIAWKLGMLNGAEGFSGSVGLTVNTIPVDSTGELGTLGGAIVFSGQTIIRLNAGDIIRLVTFGQDATVLIPSLIITQIAQ